MSGDGASHEIGADGDVHAGQRTRTAAGLPALAVGLQRRAMIHTAWTIPGT